jgi:hypothetical protein
LGTWNPPSGHSRHRHRSRGRRSSASAPAFVRYTVLILAGVLVITLAWRGVRWTVHPPQRQTIGLPASDTSAIGDAHPSDGAPWERDFRYALASAETNSEAGNVSAAEISVDRAESFVTVARLQSLPASPDIIVSSLAKLDQILTQHPDDARLLEHVTLARISLAELASSLNADENGAAVAGSRDTHVSINAPREIAAGETVDRKSFGGSDLDATLMPDTAEILLPPFTRAFTDNIRVENLTIQGAAQTLDGIRWRNVTFIGTRLRYEGGELEMDNVRFVRCRFGFPTDDRGARLANSIALGHTSLNIE